jgi:hypothetical protein
VQLHAHNLLLALLSTTTIASTVAGEENLPLIKLPEYVISGVEQATAIPGVKIQPELSVVISLPTSQSSDRPLLQSPTGRTLIENPNLFRPVGGGSTKVEASLGSFRDAQVEAVTCTEWQESGYSLQGAAGQKSRRTTTGAGASYGLKGDVVRWFGSDVLIYPALKFDANMFHRYTESSVSPVIPLSSTEHTQSEIGLGVSVTPVSVADGTLGGAFEFQHLRLDSKRDITASLDRLYLQHSTALKSGSLTNRLGIDVEVVSIDNEGTALYALESTYAQKISSSFLVRGGGILHFGKAFGNPRAGAAPSRESRSGLALQAGLSFMPEFGGVIDVDYQPGAALVSTLDLHRSWGMLDSSARGKVIQRPFRLTASYARPLPGMARIEISTSYFKELHRPYLYPAAGGYYTIAGATSSTFETAISLSSPLTERFDGTLSAVIRDVSVKGGLARPLFVHPGEFGVVLFSQWAGYDLESRLNYLVGAPDQPTGAGYSPDLLEWSSACRWRINRDFRGWVELQNILNQRSWEVPHYDVTPLSLHVGITWSMDKGLNTK